jgi:ectoine hydroxylase
VNTGDPYASRVGLGSELVRREDPVVWGHGHAPLDRGQLVRYQRDGFLVIDGLFTSTEVARLMAAAEELRAKAGPERDDVVIEPSGRAVRSLFRVHRQHALLAELVADRRIAGVARQILGDQVYVHQSRVNFKPAFVGEPFSWHSDFETWPVEDGMPRMRALSASLLLTENTEANGPLQVIPGSHQWYVRCAGRTPADHYKTSLREQRYGSPAPEAIARLTEKRAPHAITGVAGTVVFFDCNMMHSSGPNKSDQPRHNVFLVYNSLVNRLVSPFGGVPPRPEFLAERLATPLAVAGP